MKSINLFYILVFNLFSTLATNNLDKYQISFFDKSSINLNYITNLEHIKTLNDIAKLVAFQNKLGIFITNRINFNNCCDSLGRTISSLEKAESNRFIYDYNADISMGDWLKIQNLLELFQHLNTSNELELKNKFTKSDLERLAQSIIGVRHALFQYLSLPIANYQKDFEFLKDFSENPDVQNALIELNKNIKELLWIYKIVKNISTDPKILNYLYFWVFSITTIAQDEDTIELSNPNQVLLYNNFPDTKCYYGLQNINCYHLKRIAINNSKSLGSFYNSYKTTEEHLNKDLYKEIDCHMRKTSNVLSLFVFNKACEKYNLIKEIT